MNAIFDFFGQLSNIELACLTIAAGVIFAAFSGFALLIITGAGRGSDEAEEARATRDHGRLR